MRLFVELTPFRSYLDKLPDGQAVLRELQGVLVEQPKAGSVVRETGGIRKIRLAREGQGKRGGYRVWYVYLPEVERIYLLALYAKNESEDLSADQKRVLKAIVDNLKKEANREKE